jgi:hypothetical protein
MEGAWPSTRGAGKEPWQLVRATEKGPWLLLHAARSGTGCPRTLQEGRDAAAAECVAERREEKHRDLGLTEAGKPIASVQRSWLIQINQDGCVRATPSVNLY